MSTDLHDLLAPYALDSLDPHERSRFEAHLEQCSVCQSELTGLSETAVRLGDAASDTPPDSLRADVLARVEHTAQERPVVTAISARSRLRRTMPRLAVAAAVLVATAGVGGYLVENQRADDLRVQSEQMTAVMTADDSQLLSAPVETGGELRIMHSAQQDAAVVVGSDLRPLEDGEVYQVWALRGGTPHSAGLLGSRSGVLYAPQVGDADGYAVTVEPSGGSDLPTTDPVVATSA